MPLCARPISSKRSFFWTTCIVEVYLEMYDGTSKTYLGILANREVNVNLSNDATSSELLEWSTDSLLDITTQGRRQVNIVAVQDQINVRASFWLCSHLESRSRFLVTVVRGHKGGREEREEE